VRKNAVIWQRYSRSRSILGKHEENHQTSPTPPDSPDHFPSTVPTSYASSMMSLSVISTSASNWCETVHLRQVKKYLHLMMNLVYRQRYPNRQHLYRPLFMNHLRYLLQT